FDGLDAGVLLPVEALARHPVAVVVELFRRGLPVVDMPEVDLSLHFPVIERELVFASALLDAAGQPHLEYRGEVGPLVHEPVVALLFPGNQMGEKHDLVQRQLAVSSRDLLAAFGQGERAVGAETIFQGRTIFRDNPQRLSPQRSAEGRCALRACRLHGAELRADLVTTQLRVLEAMHRYTHWHWFSPLVP